MSCWRPGMAGRPAFHGIEAQARLDLRVVAWRELAGSRVHGPPAHAEWRGAGIAATLFLAKAPRSGRG